MQAIKYIPAILRKPRDEDINFILNSWLKSYRDSNFADPINGSIYFKNHKALMVNWLERGVTIVACNPEDDKQIFGWVNVFPSDAGVSIFNYLYVKHPYRRLGIGGMLFREALHQTEHDDEMPSLATHSTRMLRDLLAKKWNMIYNPYIMGAVGNE